MSFPIQKKLPAKNNKFYNTTSVGGYSHCIKGKPTQSGLNVLDNCVGWACGRFNEVYSLLSGYKSMKYWELNCNAEDFIKRGETIGLKSSKEPVYGGIMVWQGIDTKTIKRAGHVAFVERRNSDSQVYTSESGYNSFAFANKTRNKGNGNWGANSNYKYLGCLINPAITEDPLELVKDLQRNLNAQWKCGLAIDGSFGPATEKACEKHQLTYNIKATTMVKWLQKRLNKIGYKLSIDGSFGPATLKAVKNFQSKKHLNVDGIVGVKTYKSLTN